MFVCLTEARAAAGHSLRNIRWRHDSCTTQTLVIVLPTLFHEILHLTLAEFCLRGDKALFNKLDLCLSDPIMAIPPAAEECADPDTACGASRKPQLIILTGETEPLSQLEAEAKFWLAHPYHDQIKYVLVAKYDHHDQEIVVQKWAKRVEPESVPELRASVVVTPDDEEPSLCIRFDENDLNSYMVDGGEMRLKMDISEGTGPDRQWLGDIVLDQADFQRLGRRVFRLALSFVGR